MRAFYLSDLHLFDGSDLPTQRLEAFLRAEPRAGDHLILGGDIFDLFIGDKTVFKDRFAGVLSALKEAGARGVTIYYLEGNHDFHMKGVFASNPAVKVEADSFEVKIDRAKIWISHGDLIDPEDRGYRLLRWFTRFAPIRALICILPGKIIDSIGRRSAKESRKYNNTESGGNEWQQRLKNLYLEYATTKVNEGYQHVLIGHSHLKDHIPIGQGEYLNLGFSSESLVYGLLEEGKNRFEIKQYR